MIDPKEMTDDGLQEAFNKLQGERRALLSRVGECAKAMGGIHDEFVLRKHGVKVGTIVVNDKGQRFEVSSVCFDDDIFGYQTLEKPWLRGHLIKKDGTRSEKSRILFRGWEIEGSAAS